MFAKEMGESCLTTGKLSAKAVSYRMENPLSDGVKTPACTIQDHVNKGNIGSSIDKGQSRQDSSNFFQVYVHCNGILSKEEGLGGSIWKLNSFNE